MVIQLIKNTNYHGFKKAGEFLDVKNDVARRWVKNKIAVIAEEKVVDEVEETELIEETARELDEIENEIEEVEETDLNDGEDFEKLSTKELYKKCCEEGLEVEPKRNRAYYIEKLTTK